MPQFIERKVLPPTKSPRDSNTHIEMGTHKGDHLCWMEIRKNDNFRGH